MRDALPLFLQEAILSFYPTDPDGNPLTTAPLHAGALANQLRLREELEEAVWPASGDAFARAYHTGEQHVIEIERTWVVRRTLPGFRLARNQQLCLDIVWQSDRVWYRRRYRYVTGRSQELESRGVLWSTVRQAFRAGSLEEAAEDREQAYGYTTGTPHPLAAPLVAVAAPSEGIFPVGFFGEAPLIPGEFLLGHYRWGQALQLTAARAVAWAGDADTVLTLYVNGAATTTTLTLPAGTANTEVEASVALSRVLAAGDELRWQVTSGPDALTAAWHCALTVEAQVV